MKKKIKQKGAHWARKAASRARSVTSGTRAAGKRETYRKTTHRAGEVRERNARGNGKS